MDSDIQIHAGKVANEDGRVVLIVPGRRAFVIAARPQGVPLATLRPGNRVLFRVDPRTGEAAAIVFDGGPPAELRLRSMKLDEVPLPPRQPAPPPTPPLRELSSLEGALALPPTNLLKDPQTPQPLLVSAAKTTPSHAVQEFRADVRKIDERDDGSIRGWEVVALDNQQIYFVPAKSMRFATRPEPGMRVMIRPAPEADARHKYLNAFIIGIDHDEMTPADMGLVLRIRESRSLQELLSIQASIARWDPGFIHTSVVHELIASYRAHLSKIDAENWEDYVTAIDDFATKCHNRGEKETQPKIRALFANALWKGYFYSRDRAYLMRIVDRCASRRKKEPAAVKVARHSLENEDYERIITCICSPKAGLGFPIESVGAPYYGKLRADSRTSMQHHDFVNALFQANSDCDVPFALLTGPQRDLPPMDMVDVSPLRLIFVGSKVTERNLQAFKTDVRNRNENALFISNFSDVQFPSAWKAALLSHLERTYGINVFSPVSGHTFFGRRRTINEVVDAVGQNAFFLAGLRKVGKTSLALKLLNVLNIENAYHLRLSAPIPAGPLSPHAGIQLRFNIVKSRAGSEPSTEPYDFQKIRAIVEAEPNRATNTGLFVDELGLLFARRVGQPAGEKLVVDSSAAAHVVALLSWLREMIDSRKVLFIGASPTPDIVFEQSFYDTTGARYENPLFDLLNVKYVCGIDVDETMEMVHWYARRHFVQCGDQVAEAIHRLSGGIPFFSRLILNMMIDGKTRPQELTLDGVSSFDWSAVEDRSDWKAMKKNLMDRLREMNQEAGEVDVIKVVTHIAACSGTEGVDPAVFAQMCGDALTLRRMLRALEDYGYVVRKVDGRLALNCGILEKLYHE